MQHALPRVSPEGEIACLPEIPKPSAILGLLSSLLSGLAIHVTFFFFMNNRVVPPLSLPASAPLPLPLPVPPFSLSCSTCLSAGPQPVPALQPSPQPVQFSPGSCPQVLLPVSPPQQYNMV